MRPSASALFGSAAVAGRKAVDLEDVGNRVDLLRVAHAVHAPTRRGEERGRRRAGPRGPPAAAQSSCRSTGRDVGAVLDEGLHGWTRPSPPAHVRASGPLELARVLTSTPRASTAFTTEGLLPLPPSVTSAYLVDGWQMPAASAASNRRTGKLAQASQGAVRETAPSSYPRISGSMALAPIPGSIGGQFTEIHLDRSRCAGPNGAIMPASGGRLARVAGTSTGDEPAIGAVRSYHVG